MDEDLAVPVPGADSKHVTGKMQGVTQAAKAADTSLQGLISTLTKLVASLKDVGSPVQQRGGSLSTSTMAASMATLTTSGPFNPLGMGTGSPGGGGNSSYTQRFGPPPGTPPFQQQQQQDDGGGRGKAMFGKALLLGSAYGRVQAATFDERQERLIDRNRLSAYSSNFDETYARQGTTGFTYGFNRGQAVQAELAVSGVTGVLPGTTNMNANMQAMSRQAQYAGGDASQLVQNTTSFYENPNLGVNMQQMSAALGENIFAGGARPDMTIIAKKIIDKEKARQPGIDKAGLASVFAPGSQTYSSIRRQYGADIASAVSLQSRNEAGGDPTQVLGKTEKERRQTEAALNVKDLNVDEDMQKAIKDSLDKKEMEAKALDKANKMLGGFADELHRVLGVLGMVPASLGSGAAASTFGGGGGGVVSGVTTAVTGAAIKGGAAAAGVGLGTAAVGVGAALLTAVAVDDANDFRKRNNKDKNALRRQARGMSDHDLLTAINSGIGRPQGLGENLAFAGQDSPDDIFRQERRRRMSEDNDEVGGPEGGGGGGGGTVPAILGLAGQGPPHRATSTYRKPGGRTASGGISLHGSGQAVDFAGPRAGRDTPELLAINKFWAQYAPYLNELIYSGPGAIQIKNGKPHTYGGVTRRGHHDHVHVGITAANLARLKAGGAPIPGTSSGPEGHSAGEGGGGGGGNAAAGGGGGGLSTTESGPGGILESLSVGGGGGMSGGAASAYAGATATGSTSTGAAPVIGGNIGRILATIRQRESGGDYKAKSKTSTASGAYQFINGTWRGLLRRFGLEGPGSARDADNALQDDVARRYVSSILAANGDNLRSVPLTWYTGQAKEGNSVPAGGNSLTPTQYADKWMNAYGKTESYAKGAWEIAKDQIAMVHRGEMIVDANKARDIRATATTGTSTGIGGKGTPVQINVTVSGTSEAEARRLFKMIQQIADEESALAQIGAA